MGIKEWSCLLKLWYKIGILYRIQFCIRFRDFLWSNGELDIRKVAHAVYLHMLYFIPIDILQLFATLLLLCSLYFLLYFYCIYYPFFMLLYYDLIQAPTQEHLNRNRDRRKHAKHKRLRITVIDRKFSFTFVCTRSPVCTRAGQSVCSQYTLRACETESIGNVSRLLGLVQRNCTITDRHRYIGTLRHSCLRRPTVTLSSHVIFFFRQRPFFRKPVITAWSNNA